MRRWSAAGGHRNGKSAHARVQRDLRRGARLYERLGFVPLGDEEVIPGLWVMRYAHPA